MREFLGRIAVAMMMAAGTSFFGGCATFPPPKESIPNSRTYENGYEDVWEAVLETLAAQNIEVRSSEKQSREIVAVDRTVELRQYEPGRYDSRYCFCGSPPRYHAPRDLVGEYRFSVTSVSEGRTAVEINASYKASIYSEDRFTEWLTCPSKGIFEPFFLAEVDTRLSERKRPAPTPSIKGREPSRKLDWWKPSRGY